jgi:hypothetical protein
VRRNNSFSVGLRIHYYAFNHDVWTVDFEDIENFASGFARGFGPGQVSKQIYLLG